MLFHIFWQKFRENNVEITEIYSYNFGKNFVKTTFLLMNLQSWIVDLTKKIFDATSTRRLHSIFKRPSCSCINVNDIERLELNATHSVEIQRKFLLDTFYLQQINYSIWSFSCKIKIYFYAVSWTLESISRKISALCRRSKTWHCWTFRISKSDWHLQTCSRLNKSALYVNQAPLFFIS